MTQHEANQYLLLQLKKIYDASEAMHIADLVMENITGKTRMSRTNHLNEKLSPEQELQLENYIPELLTSKPVQYVLNEAWFAGMKFYVDENVLIPRPETEELVEWVVEESKSTSANLSILDVGTGSGCIAIALKKKLPEANIYAIDISENALTVAKKNASRNNADITFLKNDILSEQRWNNLPDVDIIVSNPPYIPEGDKTNMHANVVNFEPHLALFVADSDPLIFYREIVRFSKRKPVKQIFFEIHQDLGEQLQKLFLNAEFESVLKKDLNSNNRFLYLTKK